MTGWSDHTTYRAERGKTAKKAQTQACRCPQQTAALQALLFWETAPGVEKWARTITYKCVAAKESSANVHPKTQIRVCDVFGNGRVRRIDPDDCVQIRGVPPRHTVMDNDPGGITACMDLLSSAP